MARKLVELGVDILEAGFPIASQGDFDSVEAIAREFPWVQVAALARACTLDVERAARALEHARRPRIHTFIATSDIHLKYKLHKTREQVLEQAVAAVELARRYADDVEFSAEDATRTEPDFLEEISRAVVAAGARTVNLPDTVGYSVPEEYGPFIGRIAKALGDSAIVSVHCHNDLGLASANSLAGVQCGRAADRVHHQRHRRAGGELRARRGRDGVQDPPGPSARSRPASSPSSFTRPASFSTELIAFGPQPNKAIVGSNAFAHEAGIHQDGFLKERTTYEIMDPHSVGVPESTLILGKHSGRHALNKRCQDLGFELTKEELDAVYQRFIAIADGKKGVTNEEILELVENRSALTARAE